MPSKPKTTPKNAQAVKKGSSVQEAAARRAAFVEAYLLSDGNITQAALAAGFSPKTAAQQGARLFKHVEVQNTLRHRRAQVVAKVQETVQLTAERIMASLAQALFFDPRKT